MKKLFPASVVALVIAAFSAPTLQAQVPVTPATPGARAQYPAAAAGASMPAAVPPGAGAAAVPAGAVAINAITVNLPKTPEIQTREQIDKRYALGTWAEIEVDFASAAPAPELEFKYYVLIGGQMLTGEVTHVNILPGRNLFSVMYVAPRTLTALTRGAPLTAQTIQNVAVQIFRPGVSAPVAESVRRAPFNFATIKQTTGLMFNKAETPFANLWWDRYEAIKPTKQ